MKHTMIRILLVPALSLQLAGSALFLAANSGAAVAGYDEGVAAYERGDYATAFEEVSAAAEQGDARAQYGLGILYAEGNGVPQDYAAAVKWYRPRAAEQGLSSAQYNLGTSYALGEGVPQDYIQAHMWFNLAAANGNEDAVKRRDNVAKKLTSVELTETQRLRIYSPMREIVLDTETTGLDPLHGDRLVEIGGIELINHVPTGKTFQSYLNPERDMPASAFAVHGLSAEFLADKPLFTDVAEDFLKFIGNDPLIIHNAGFDLSFIDAELARLNRPALARDAIIDTLLIARRKFPGAPASLDALCRRFAIDTSSRKMHGALLDAGLLAEVYLALIGGRQPGLGLVSAAAAGAEAPPAAAGEIKSIARPPRPHAPTTAEIEAHTTFIDGLKNPLWRLE